MKRLFILLTLAIIYLTSRYLHKVEEEKHTYVISVLKYHYIVESIKDKMIIPLFISEIEHEMTLLENIDRIQLKNNVMIFDVSLESIFMHHQETKDDMTYYMFEYQILLPRFNVDMYLENLFCIITEIDGTLHEYRIGTLEIFITPDIFDSSWSEIQAIRQKEILSIEYIDIKTTEDVTLSMSNHIETSTISYENGFKMFIPKSIIIFLDIPVMIVTPEKKEMIIGIQWISSKRILSQAEGFYVIYHLYKDQSRETL
jgi:hypothetical protein